MVDIVQNVFAAKWSQQEVLEPRWQQTGRGSYGGGATYAQALAKLDLWLGLWLGLWFGLLLNVVLGSVFERSFDLRVTYDRTRGRM